MVAIASLYLRKTGRLALLGAVRSGLVVSVIASITLGVALAAMGAMSPLWEGTLALVAAAAVLGCVWHMQKMGKQMSGEISAGMGKALLLDGANAWWAVFVFTLFMVGREGVESAAMLASLARSDDMSALLAGGLIGLAAAATLAWLWTRFGRQVNLSRFFQVTSVFMLAFALMLVLKSFYEFTEIDLIPGIDNVYWHHASAVYVRGPYAQIASLLLVLAPTVWLVAAHWLDKRRSRTPVGARA